MIIGRVANLTAPHNGRTQCQFSNRCWEGCPFGGYFSTQSSTLPAATATGNLTVRPFSLLQKSFTIRIPKKQQAWKYWMQETNKTYEYKAKSFSLCICIKHCMDIDEFSY